MVTVSNSGQREIIARAPSVHQDIQEIVAYHDEEGPTIDVVVNPEDTPQYAQFGLTPAGAHQLADELHRLADVAQRAGWTPTVLAGARGYLPGMTDEEIVERLDRLYRRWGGFVIGYRGRLEHRAGRALAVEVQIETLDRSVTLVEHHAKTLSGIPEMADHLNELRRSLADVKQLYVAELESHQ